MLSVGNNRKLGPRVASISRPVGPSCPPACPFLTGQMPDGSEIPKDELCYAESIQVRYPSVRKSWESNYHRDPEARARWRVEMANRIVKARSKRRPVVAVRIHVGGDFLRAGALDRDYLADLLRVLRDVRERCGDGCAYWFYTHAWRELAPHVAYLRRLDVQCFASVHSASEARDALALGYRLAIDPGKRISPETPSTSTWNGLKVLTCPEQRKGADAVTCTTCGYCFREYKEARHVAFYRH